MRILLAGGLQYGGETGDILTLAAELQRQGQSPLVLLIGYPPGLRQFLAPFCRPLPVYFAAAYKEAEKVALALQPQVIDVHTPPEYGLARRWARLLRIPWVATYHGEGRSGEQPQEAAALVVTAGTTPAPVTHRRTFHLPPAVDLQALAPRRAPGRVVRITFSAGAVGQKVHRAVNKALDLFDERDFCVSSPSPPLSLNARYLGWQPLGNSFLPASDILIGCGRFAAEGLAAGNAVLLLGNRYAGLLMPEKLAAGAVDLGAINGEAPCYRQIFFDLQRLCADDRILQVAQQESRRYARDHFNLRLSAEKRLSVYRQAREGF